MTNRAATSVDGPRRKPLMSRLFAVTSAVLVAASAQAADIDFVHDVAPILERACVRCHQPANEKGDLSLATADDALEQGYVVPGKPDESRLLDVVVSGPDGKSPTMPKEGAPLSPDDVAVLRRWIAADAEWPRDVVVRERSKADRTWWSLQPLSAAEPPLPAGLPDDWFANPIDRFIFAKLAESKLKPSPPADAAVLCRRLHFDLTGLPPTPDELAKFAAEATDDAGYAAYVDRLLASPRYGEHWGRHWLDVVRFGESNGYERNVIIDNAWPYRDWVIRAVNEDLPFADFVAMQLAGDAVGRGDPQVEAGVAFLTVGPYDNVNNQDAAQKAIIRADELDDMVRAVGEKVDVVSQRPRSTTDRRSRRVLAAILA